MARTSMLPLGAMNDGFFRLRNRETFIAGRDMLDISERETYIGIFDCRIVDWIYGEMEE